MKPREGEATRVYHTSARGSRVVSLGSGYNTGMKVWIILLSVLATTLTWWSLARKLQRQEKSIKKQMSLVFKSLAAGVAMYFSLMLLALLWLAVAPG